MASEFENFFQVGIIDQRTFFDEGPIVRSSVVSTNTGSIDTSAIDGYRQGIEITQQKYFDAGLAKIHAGEPGHVLRQNGFGMSETLNDAVAFSDLDRFNPVIFIRSQERGALPTLPITINDDSSIENRIADGAIEPLTIRAVVLFADTDAVHSIKGEFSSGNPDRVDASDRLFTVDYVDAQQPGFNELGTFKTLNRSPFTDARYIRNVSSSIGYQSDLTTAMSLLSGSTDNYVSFKQRSAPAGYSYDNTPTGTDSVSFGGMTY